MLLLGRINRSKSDKVSRNIDAFFDPSVDNIQDNFYDIPFIPKPQNNPIKDDKNTANELSERDIFEFGRDELFQLNEENEFNKRDCDNNYNNIKLEMNNIEEDEAVLENRNRRKIRRLLRDDFLSRKRYISPLHFVHKFRHKNVQNKENVEKRGCDKSLKLPHKHRNMEYSYHSSAKHEAFKEDLMDIDNACPDPTKKQKNTAIGLTTKHKQLKAKKITTIITSTTTTTTTTPSTTTTTVTCPTKSSIPPTKNAIKSVLSHKTSKTTTTTTTKKPCDDDYEDYKAGDYIEDRFSKLETRRNCEDIPIKPMHRNNLEEYLGKETTKGANAEFRKSPVLVKDEAIEKFVKKETPKPIATFKANVRRSIPEKRTKPPVGKIEQFLNSEISKTSENKINKKVKTEKSDFLLQRTPFLPKTTTTTSKPKSKMIKEMVDPQRKYRDYDPRNIFIVDSKNDYTDDNNNNEYDEDPEIKQQIFIAKPKSKPKDKPATVNPKVVKIKEMNRKLYHNNNNNKNGRIYVPHTKNQGRQHHKIYYEKEKLKKKLRQKIDVFTTKNDVTRNSRQYIKYDVLFTPEKNRKIKYQSEDDDTTMTSEITENPIPDLPKIPEKEDSEEIEELYKEIPVNKNRIELTLNCDNNDYLNKDHCICSVKTMLRDLMDDLKDINATSNYQYDCSKYINIEPGIVIANDSVASRKKRFLFNLFQNENNILLRRGSRIGRDVDNLLNERAEVDYNIENEIFAIVGSKVEMNCGNSSEEYNEDDKITWSVSKGAPETAGIKEDSGHKLVIERVAAQDTNNYTCEISHRLEDGSYGTSKKFLHKLSIIELPIYSIMVTVLLNESAKCDQEDLEILHQYYPVMLQKFLCSGNEQTCHISLDSPHCTTNIVKNGVTMHAQLKTAPLYSLLPALKTRQEDCSISCQSRVYSIIVKTLLYNLASVTNLPVFFRDNNEHKKFTPIQYDMGDKSNVFSNSILTMCPLGFGILQNNEKMCITCEPHTYNPGNKKECIPCPSGSYQPNHGSGSCLPCTSPLDNSRCLFGTKADLAPKLYFLIPLMCILLIIALIVCCIFAFKSSEKKKQNIDYIPGEIVQTKVIEQVFTGVPSDKSYSTVNPSEKRKSSIKRPSVPPSPPPIDFN